VLGAFLLSIHWKLSRPRTRQMKVTSGTELLPRGLYCGVAGVNVVMCDYE